MSETEVVAEVLARAYFTGIGWDWQEMTDAERESSVVDFLPVARSTAEIAGAAVVEALREAADAMEQFEPFPGEEPDWLRTRADRRAER